MSKDVTTYWTNSSKLNKQKRATPNWIVFGIIILVTFMVCISINLRAYSELTTEIAEHETLNSEIKKLTVENQLLLKEVTGLKTDPGMIEREARKIGMGRPNKKNLAPGN